MFNSVGLLIELIAFALQSLRLGLRRAQSRNWPLVSGTVQRAYVLPKWGWWAPGEYRSIFGYALPANGSRYAGFFALEANNEQDADALQKQLPGTTVMLRYNPGNPDISILQDERVAGRKLTQSPHWLP